MTETEKSDKLLNLLGKGPARSAVILKELGISQPTFSRLWSTIRDGVALGATNTRQYALRRHTPGVDTPLPVFRVSEGGTVEAIGQLDVFQGGFYAMTPPEGAPRPIYQGMPFFIRDLRPQGFLGRMEPGKHPGLDLPANILLWTDEQILKYISRCGESAAGDLILGNESYARYLTAIASDAALVIPENERAMRYPGMAEDSMQGEPPGSSAGGEQPKFTAMIRPAGTEASHEHVIVKFSPRIGTASGRRWADLLICEHLALEVLARNGIAAAKTSILEAGERIFLEVVRFDRVGLRGRRPMSTFHALDGDLGMMDQPWSAVARELGRLGLLQGKDIETVEILDLYGALIGNTDKHHGNIAVAWSFENGHRLLPAYDMLPMYYRPNAHGEIVERAWTPALIGRLEFRHLPRCFNMAAEFWNEVLAAPQISADFKEVAQRHFLEVRKLVPDSNFTSPASPPPRSAPP